MASPLHSRRPKSRTMRLAEALEAQQAISESLSHIDLRTIPRGVLRDSVKLARENSQINVEVLVDALQADAALIGSTARRSVA